MIVRTRIAVCLVLSATTAAMAQIPASARADAKAGRVDAAIGAFQPLKNAEAKELLCRLYASVDQRDEAITACESAASLAPDNSEYALQLAHAYGDKASHSGSFTGMRMVGRIRGSFERAVQLSPRSIDALSDLGQFYVDAPSIVGGGLDKAREIVTRLQPLSPARARRLSAMIAAKAKDDATAESEYKAELAASPSAEAYVDLARFYQSRKQPDRAADYANRAVKADTHHGGDTLDAAAILTDTKHGQDAQAAIRAYLNTPQDTVADYARAHVLLGTSLKTAGDAAGSQREFEAALALAHDYEAARKGAAR